MWKILLCAVLALAPVDSAFPAESDGCRVYRSGPDDPERGTVVLVPGLTGCAYGFRSVAAGLEEEGCRVLLIEPLGVGASDRPADADYSLTAQSDRLAAIMSAHRTGPCLVVAHGVSGSMALRLAYRHPGLVSGVLSIEGGPDETCLTPTVEKTLGLVSLVAKLGGKRLLRDRMRESLEAASGDTGWIDGWVVRKYFQGPGRDISATVKALKQMAKAEEEESLQDNLARIECPVRVMLGGAVHEGAPDAESLRRLEAGVADCRFREVPGAGHFIFEEQPRVVVREILDLLDATGNRLVSTAMNSGGESCAQ